MLYSVKDGILEPRPFSSIDGTEKELENLIADNLQGLFCEESALMTIFQERKFQEEPDIIALDKQGNLVIFELKRYATESDTTLQILRYAQKYGQKKYSELETYYKNYTPQAVENLSEKHREVMGLKAALPPEAFNRKQRLIIIGNASDNKSLNTVNYWKEQGLDIDFIPYRFYNIDNKLHFEFFAKPYDIHINPADRKGILFDSNKSYAPDAIWNMLEKGKVSAYGSVKEYVNRFKKDDYVLLYHKGYGLVAVGVITSTDAKLINSGDGEMYQSVKWCVPENLPTCEKELRGLPPGELEMELRHSFFYARTDKVPYLSVDECKNVITLLQKKYEQKG